MLPFEEELGTHPNFETMRIHVSKENNRPRIPITLRLNEATHMLQDTIEECWDADAEARLSALCVQRRFQEIDMFMEHKGMPYPTTYTVSYPFCLVLLWRLVTALPPSLSFPPSLAL